MAKPTTYILLEAAQACLQAITQANGYYTDAGEHTTLEPSQVPESQGLVLAIALDTKAAASDDAVSRTHRRVEFVVIGKVATDLDDGQERLHELLADIEQAFDRKQATFPKGYQYPVFVDAKPIPPADGMKWMGAMARYYSHVPKR